MIMYVPPRLTCSFTLTHSVEHRDRNYKGGNRSEDGHSMHLSSRGEFGQAPTRAVWPKGLRGPPLPLLPLRIEVGWIRLALSHKKKWISKAQETEMWISQKKKQVVQHERDLDHMYLKKTFLPGGDGLSKDEQLNRDGIFSHAFPQGGGFGSSWVIIPANAKVTRLKEKLFVCSF